MRIYERLEQERVEEWEGRSDATTHLDFTDVSTERLLNNLQQFNGIRKYRDLNGQDICVVTKVTKYGMPIPFELVPA